jgi:hypothetical protein
MTSGQITIRQFTADDTVIWRTIRLEASANAPIAFGQTLEDAEKQAVDDYRKTVSGPFPPFAAFDGALAIGTAGFYILGGPKMSPGRTLGHVRVADIAARALGAS